MTLAPSCSSRAVSFDAWLRARVTSTGLLKPCLCYGEGTDLRALLRGGAGDAALEQAMAATIYEKPRSHCFGTGPITEQHVMAAIGG